MNSDSVVCYNCHGKIKEGEEYNCDNCHLKLCPMCFIKNLRQYKLDCPQCSSDFLSAKSSRLEPHKSNILAALSFLNDVRVIQRGLVYVVGLPIKYANEDTLLKYEFFGQYGPIKKIVVNSTHVHSTNQNMSVSSYVTFRNFDDATECIYALENFSIDGCQMKASFGTTKYCASFLRGLKCSNPDCMYLHKAGIPSDSFSKDDITTSSSKFIEMTRPLRPSDYNQYPLQNARPTILPPRRLRREILIRKIRQSPPANIIDAIKEDEEDVTLECDASVSLRSMLGVPRRSLRSLCPLRN